MPSQPPEIDIVFIDGEESFDQKRVLPPSHALKRKVGNGGFDPKAIALAEQRLSEAKNLFPQIAADDIQAIQVAMTQLVHATQTKEWLERITWAAVELRSNGAMFQYPLVTAVAELLYLFLLELKKVTPLSQQVIQLHHNALLIAMDHGPRAITNTDEIELLHGLRKAAKKALAEN